MAQVKTLSQGAPLGPDGALVDCGASVHPPSLKILGTKRRWLGIGLGDSPYSRTAIRTFEGPILGLDECGIPPKSLTALVPGDLSFCLE